MSRYLLDDQPHCKTDARRPGSLRGSLRAALSWISIMIEPGNADQRRRRGPWWARQIPAACAGDAALARRVVYCACPAHLSIDLILLRSLFGQDGKQGEAILRRERYATCVFGDTLLAWLKHVLNTLRIY